MAIRKIRVLIVDDHAMVRRGLRHILADDPQVEVVGEAGDGATALKQVGCLRPEVVLMDIRIPLSDGIQVTRQLKLTYPDTRILAMTTYDDDEVLSSCLRAGVDGFLLKTVSPSELLAAIRSVHEGDRVLDEAVVGPAMRRFADMARRNTLSDSDISDIELEVLGLIAAGATNKQIALKYFWSERTAKRKVQEVYRKLDVADRTQAVAAAMKRGLL